MCVFLCVCQSLEVLVRGKALELEQVCDAWRNVQRQQQESEERQSRILRERDAIISQLQGALHARTQETQVQTGSDLNPSVPLLPVDSWFFFFSSPPQDLRCSLLAQIQSAPSDVLEELKVRLQLKDRLFQEVLADRTHQAQEHQEQVQDLLRTISSRDQYIQVEQRSSAEELRSF